MPDIQTRGDDRLSRYDAMSTEALQAFLREEASKPAGEESDTKEILYVMEVLAGRRKAQTGGKDPAEALASFKSNYYTENEIPSVSENAPAARKRSGCGHWKRGLVAAIVAISILLIGNSISANALGFDLFAVIAKWTQETFHFGTAAGGDTDHDPKKDSEEVFTDLQNALDDYDITLPLVPSYIPEGYVGIDVKIQDSPKQRVFRALYQNEANAIVVRIAYYLDATPTQIEQNDFLIEVYSTHDLDFYIFDNSGTLNAVWISESFECYISGPLSLSEIKNMIDSIWKG